MLTKKFIFLYIYLLLFSCGSETPVTGISSNPNFIKGTVVDKESKSVSNCYVYLYDLQTISIKIDSTISDSIGEFSFVQPNDIDDFAIEFVKDSSLKNYSVYSNVTDVYMLGVSSSFSGNVDVSNLQSQNIDYNNVRLIIKNSPYFSTLDSEGNYSFLHVPKGNYTFLIVELLDEGDITILEENLDILQYDNSGKLIETIYDTITQVVTLSNENSEVYDSYIVSTKSSVPDGSSTWLNTNHGKRTIIAIGTYDNNTMMSGLIKFDLLSNDSLISIDSAFIVLTIDTIISKWESKVAQFSTNALLKDWREGIASFNDPDSSLNNEYFDGVTAKERFYGEDWSQIGIGCNGVDAEEESVFSEYAQLDTVENKNRVRIPITNIYARWIDGSLVNNGVIIRNSDALNDSTFYDYPCFYSSDVSDNSVTPKLEIYQKIKIKR